MMKVRKDGIRVISACIKAGSVFLDQRMVEMINYHPSEIFAELNRTSILKVFSIDLNPPS